MTDLTHSAKGKGMTKHINLAAFLGQVGHLTPTGIGGAAHPPPMKAKGKRSSNRSQ